VRESMKTARLLLPVAARRRPNRFPRALGLLVGAAVGVFGLCWMLDYFVFGAAPGGRPTQGPLALFLTLDVETLQNALSALSQVVVAVLGIAITVVSIIVQLAATRYTSRVADMFFRDRTNLAILGFFVVGCLQAVWVSLAVSKGFVPRATIIMTLAMVTATLLLLVPYFAYVFDFLDPEKVILRLGQQVLDAALGRRTWERSDLFARQAAATTSLEHLADVAVNATAQKDKVIAGSAVAAMREVCAHYLATKQEQPEEWFRLGERTRENPDFIALALPSVLDLERQKVWFEWKALRHFRNVFAESLEHLPEAAHVVAIETRHVGEAAVQAGDRPLMGVVLKFFNTYLRATLNDRNVRAAYSTLNQYRELAEQLMRHHQHDVVIEVGKYLAYYGQTAHAMDLGFVTETAAHDLSALCERAFETNAPCHDQLLRTFLEVDKEAETKVQERTLRGVRKAQAKLASYYLLNGAEMHARTIFRDMAHEAPERLASIEQELAAVTSKDFWEVTDRGVNFDYLDTMRKEQLAVFFVWFRQGKDQAGAEA
jgi:hypothetical protein